jgi:hypothetical protein
MREVVGSIQTKICLVLVKITRKICEMKKMRTKFAIEYSIDHNIKETMKRRITVDLLMD